MGDRMKMYEGAEAGRRLMPLVPIVARLDGRAFHTFCRGLRRPFDERFHELMVDVTLALVDETTARIGYTQSDEISLVWQSEDPKSEVFFAGRVQKMVSVLAAVATAVFNRRLPMRIPEKAHLMPVFDARVWSVPTQIEATNALLWRERDASRNSVLAVGQAHFSHKEMQGLSTKQVQEKLFQERGINWATDTPDWAKRGTWLRRVTRSTPFTTEELDALPPKHTARSNPNLVVERSVIERVDMPKFGSVVNRIGVIFHGDQPLVGEE
jgi:tRNA(His) 5'-end guanylyltransferase